MKYLYNKKGFRRSDHDRRPFAFFAVGAAVLFGVGFVAGLQVGRHVGPPGAGTGAQQAASPPAGQEARKDPTARAGIRNDLNAFSDEAAKVPAVQPQTAKEELAETEKEVTFRQTLSGKEASAVPLAPRKDVGSPAAPDEAPARRYVVQAGAFRDPGAAEALKAKLAKNGFKATILRGNPRGKERRGLYRVVVGPFSDKEEARRMFRKVRDEMKINAMLVAA